MVWSPRSEHDRSSILNVAWFAMLMASGLLLLVPGLAEEGSRFGHLQAYPQDIVQNIYRLIRVAMPFLPVGMLLALALPARSIRLVVLSCVAACAGLALAGLSVVDGVALVRDLMFVIPGVAAGIWLAARSHLVGVGSLRETGAVGETRNAPAPRSLADGGSTSATEPSQERLKAASAIGNGRGTVGRWSVRVSGLALFLCAMALAVDLPRWGLWVAPGLAMYAVLLLWRPLTGLLVIPAALALVDLAPWTGRFFLDEFDLLMLTTLAVALFQGRLWSGSGPSGRLQALLLVVVPLTCISLLLGLFPLQAWDVNAWSAYWSQYNSLRLAKGLLWGLVLFGQFKAWPVRAEAFSMLCIGMAVGTLGVGAWALWEHALFAGAATTLDYRVTAGFSSMHTGGGHFEAYLVMALPFVWGLVFQAHHWAWRLLSASVFVLGSYAMLTTVARGGLIALAVALLVLVVGTWRAHAPTGVGSGARRGWFPALLGLATVATMLVGISGGFWQQRLAQTAADAEIRLRHWSDVLDLRDGSWATRLFGQGLGSLPASNLAHKLPDEAGSYRFGRDGDKAFLALNSTGTLYMAQRVLPQPGETLSLQLLVRVPNGKGGLQASLCEKNLFNSRKCRWLDVAVDPGTSAWQSSQQTFSTGDIGAGNWLTRRPVQFSLYNPVAGTIVDVTGVRLRDASGRDLLHNGGFGRGGDFWFFNSGDHLFWHAKNLWVHVLFEQGWLGLLAFAMLVILACTSLARPFARGHVEATVWLAALVGMLTTSIVESLLDAPRLALLAYFMLFSAASFVPSKPLSDSHAARQRHRHH